MAIEATSDLLIGQWVDSPRLRAAIDAVLDAVCDGVIESFERLDLMRQIDSAEGVWLDYIGIRLGYSRPSTVDPASDQRFGFDSAGVGFDQGPFRGDVANDASFPLADEIYRDFLQARAVLVLGDGTYQTFAKAVRQIDPAAAIQDRRDMTVRIVTGRRAHLELADQTGALPRNAGVLLIYAETGRFGFDSAGVGFDQGPFRESS